MANTSTADATAPKTPPHGVDSGSEIKSTPLAVGSAAVSEFISTVGVDVSDVRPWIGRDVESYRECPIDEMLQELLYRCKDDSKPLPDKPTLLADCLKAVLPICNKGNDAKNIKKNLSKIVESTKEAQMYRPFTEVSNLAFDRLSKINPPGLLRSKAHDDEKILFHQNDPKNIIQKHQGETSTRRPDVVIVSRTSAKKVSKHPDQPYKDEQALEKPAKRFQWTDVRSTVEFKHNKLRTGVSNPPKTYAVNAYDVPEAKKYMKYRRETNDTAKATDVTPLPGSSAATSSRQTSDARTRGRLNQSRAGERSKRSGAGGASKQSGPVNNRKRGSSQAADGHSSKKLKVDDSEKEPPKPPEEPNEPEKKHPVLQNGLYASELFAAHIARQSVITYVVNDDMIYLWYFDRQDAIQCSGINFVQDLPRFMVLLLALQRMPYAEWGYNRVFERKDGSSHEVRLPDEDMGEVDLTFDLKSDKRITHFGLRGRATTVFPVKSKKLSALVPTLPHHNPHNPTDELVAKLYWPEEERESEAEILNKVYEIAAEDKEGKVKHHVPEMVWYYKFEDTSTANIRRALGLKDAERGRRVLYIIIFRKLDPITDLSNEEFLAAWWHIVVCHYALWENNVHHRDVSPSNLMVYKTSDGRYIGVLNDFDLSSTQDSPSGQERTGTIPFMAIELLTKEAIKGEVQHLYRHDAESFIWVLTWVSLRYQEGQLLRKCRPLDEWLKVDAIGCRKEKNDFLNTAQYSSTPSPSHRRSWEVVQSSLEAMDSFYKMKHKADRLKTVYAVDRAMKDLEADVSEARYHVSYSVTDATVFKTWFEDIIRTNLPAQFLDVRV